MIEQMTLFGEEEMKPTVKRPKGGSQSSIVFHDYESFLAKFADNPKTTDDCFTPADVYEAVVKYVGTIIDLSDKVILRPFFPGGDYENAEYPENGVVIDNPPFSMFTNIVKFYTARDIPFFLFGNGMTIAIIYRFCTAVIISEQITFENGAYINVNFASNLFGSKLITTAPLLDQYLRECPSQKTKVNLPKYEYPTEFLHVADMQTICKGGIDFSVDRSEAIEIRSLDNYPKSSLSYGPHLLITTEKAKAKAEAKAKAKAEATKNVIPIELSDRERRIVEKLEQQQQTLFQV